MENEQRLKPKIQVVRLSTRGYRDLRITTHCCLVARAFGAEAIYLDAGTDGTIAQTVERVAHQFGGGFKVHYVENPYKTILALKKEGYEVVHLTMYGEKPEKALKKMKKTKVCVVVGSEKVPAEVYETADWNVSITRQPHSEVAALAVFMHELTEGREEGLVFRGGKIKVVPAARRKNVQRQD